MLTDIAIKALFRKATAAGKPKKKADRLGLVLYARPSGTGSWRWNYIKPNGLADTKVYGKYPEISLNFARELHFEARRLLERGVDPKEATRTAQRVGASTFSAVAEDHIKNSEKKLAPKTTSTRRQLVREYLNPQFGSKQVSEVRASDVLAAIRKIEAQGNVETPHKALELCRRVLIHAVVSGLCEHNVAEGLSYAIKRRVKSHYAAITDPVPLGQLIRTIAGYQGQPQVQAALRLAPHVFLRPGELRMGKWSEIDLKAAEWNIPAERMKMKVGHLVPLSTQCVAILRDLKELAGEHASGYVFPAIGVKPRPISENTLGGALRALGYAPDVHVPHGFRATARTILDEILEFRVDWIEHQLAHEVKDPNGRAYNRTSFLPQRRKMMQAWSDYLESLPVNNVIPIGRSAVA